MLLLLTIAIACAFATFTESRWSAKAAYAFIYNAPWFNAWLLLLCINLLCSAFTRWPWKRKHIGFVTTHMGIILLLIGAMIGRTWGLEANVTLEMSKPPQNRLIAIRKSILLVQSMQTGELYSMPFDAELLNKPKSLPLPDHSLRLRVEKYSQNLKLNQRLIASNNPSDGPCIHLLFKSNMTPEPIHVFLSNTSPSFDFFGMGQIVWRTNLLEKGETKKEWYEKPILYLWGSLQEKDTIGYAFTRNPLTAGVPNSQGKLVAGASPIHIGWANWTVELVSFLPQGRIELDAEEIDSKEETNPSKKQNQPNQERNASGLLACLVDPKTGQTGEKRWIISGSSQMLALDSHQVLIGYGLETYPLPFAIELIHFEVPRDTHSKEPSDFISTVQFIDPNLQRTEEARIQMNAPATYPSEFWRKITGLTYKFSQAGWNPQNLKETTLQVLYDPGWLFKWIGSLMISMGIFTMFYLKPVVKKE